MLACYLEIIHVYAFITNKEIQHLWREFYDEVDKGKHRLSSRKLKQKLQENYKKSGRKFFPICAKEQLEEVTEGAAVTISKSKPPRSYIDYFVNFFVKCFCHFNSENVEHPFVPDEFNNGLLLSSDIVLSIFCEGWPSCAKEWITRERLWPDVHSVEKITDKVDFTLSQTARLMEIFDCLFHALKPCWSKLSYRCSTE